MKCCTRGWFYNQAVLILMSKWFKHSFKLLCCYFSSGSSNIVTLEEHLMTQRIMYSSTKMLLRLCPCSWCIMSCTQESACGHSYLHAHCDDNLPADQCGLLCGAGHAVFAGQWCSCCGKSPDTHYVYIPLTKNEYWLMMMPFTDDRDLPLSNQKYLENSSPSILLWADWKWMLSLIDFWESSPGPFQLDHSHLCSNVLLWWPQRLHHSSLQVTYFPPLAHSAFRLLDIRCFLVHAFTR